MWVSSPSPGPRVWLAVVVLMTLVAGCVAPDDQNGDGGNGGTGGNGTDPGNGGAPVPGTLHFDGARAHELALQQIYEDPANHTGPRYRLPGSETTDAVAAELQAALSHALDPVGGTARIVDFTGTDYYALDLWPVATYVCDEGDAARDRVRDITFHNIVGRTDPDEVGLIIGAHYDSKRHADFDTNRDHHDEPVLGADDGAAGAAAVVELARALAQNPPGIPVTYVLFDGEDGFADDDCHPLAGSLHFAQTLSDDDVAAAHGMVLLDMIGNASAKFYREGNSLEYRTPSGVFDSSWLGDLVWQTAASMEVTAFVNTSTSAIADDHLPFLYEGIPSLDIIRYDESRFGTRHFFAEYWHTVRDDHTAIQPEGIERVGRVVEASVHVLAARVGDDAAS